MSDERDDEDACASNLRKRVTFRADDELIRRIDALIPTLSTTWYKATRSDVLRKLVDKGLGLLEEEARRARFAEARGNDESDL